MNNLLWQTSLPLRPDLQVFRSDQFLLDTPRRRNGAAPRAVDTFLGPVVGDLSLLGLFPQRGMGSQ